MTTVARQQFVSGLYIIHWKEECGGGRSLAAVGQLPSGRYWIAPTNWVNGSVSLDSQLDKIGEMVRVEIPSYEDED